MSIEGSMDWRLQEWIDELLNSDRIPGLIRIDTFDLVVDFLNEEPEQVRYLVEMFESETDIEKKSWLGTFIVKHEAHPGVIEFLREKVSWTDEDFKGTAVSE